MQYVFGDCVLDTARHELRRAGVPVPLERKVYHVLAYLVQHAERLVTKDELLDHVWPGVYVTDKVVTRCIAILRKAVGDTPRAQRVLQTRHGGKWFTEILPAEKTSRRLEGRSAPEVMAVSAVDRCGNLSAPAVLERKTSPAK